MDQSVAAGDLRPTLRQRVLFAALFALCGGYLAAFGLFSVFSRDFISADRERDARRFAQAHPLTLPALLAFGNGQNGVEYLGAGWNIPEPGGVWSDSPRATWVALVACDCALLLTLRLAVFQPPHERDNAVEIFVDGQSFIRAQRGAYESGPLRVRIPRRRTRTEPMTIEIRVDRADSPFRRGRSEDRRTLGVKLLSADIEALHGA